MSTGTGRRIRNGQAYLVGRHVLACGDVEEGHVEAAVRLARDAGVDPRWCYTDPPWNPGIARLFRRWADADRPVDLDHLYRSFLRQSAEALPPGAPLWLELSPRAWRLWVRPVVEETGHAVNAVRKASWEDRRGKHETVQARIRLRPQEAGPEPVGSTVYLDDGLHGEESTESAFRSDHDAGAVLDPFVGYGLSVRFAERCGISCVGLELNPDRLRDAVTWLREEAGAPEPRILGRLS